MALVRTITLSAVGLITSLATPAAAQYRGMTAGWPQQTGGNYAAYYPGNNATGPAYYVARPVSGGYANGYTTSGYAPAGYAPAGGYVQVVPTTAAYANPNYTAAYGAAPMQAQQRYAYYGAAPVGYGAPVTAGYAPLQSYRVTPAGGSTAGAEAYANYGQPAAINYVPPRFVYRTNYAQVPVYMYRPVTVLQPGTGQPVTCLQPTTTTQCQPQRQRWFSHSWFNWGRSSSCGSSGCGTTACGTAPVAAANYCTTNYCQTQPCGQQPYYPTQPGVIIPTVPGSPTTMPGTIITPIPAGPSIPPPGTRFPAGSTFVPADVAPSLNSTPRGSLGTPSGGTIIPGTPSTIPGTTTPGTSLPRTPGSTPSFPVDPVPGVTNPSGSGFGGGAFPSGSNYAPATDPLTGAAAPADQSRTTRYRSEVTGPALKPPTTSSPITAPALHPSIQPVPDPAAGQPTRPVNRAPQLLDPRDKTAARQGDQRWAVVPAVWPSPNRTLQAERSPYRHAVEERSLTTPARPAAADASQYDDGGWASSR